MLCRCCKQDFIQEPLLFYQNMPKSAQFFPDENTVRDEHGVDLLLYQCPYCGMKPANKVPVLHLKTERRPGQWMPDGELVVYPNYQLYKWHIFDNVSSNETTTDNAPVAYCVFHQGQWLLVNQALNSLTSPSGKRVEIGQAVALVHGAQIRLSQSQHGRFIEVEIV